MKLLPSEFTSPSVRWVAAGCLAVALAGGAGFLAAGSSVAEVDPSKLPQRKALLPAGAASGSAAPPVVAASGSSFVRSDVKDAEERVRMEQIWEVSIGTEALAAVGTGVQPAEVWRIGGVFESAAGPALIVVSGTTGSPRYMSVGEVLPNKAEIVAIARDSVTVRTRINKRWVRVTLNV